MDGYLDAYAQPLEIRITARVSIRMLTPVLTPKTPESPLRAQLFARSRNPQTRWDARPAATLYHLGSRSRSRPDVLT